VDEIIKVLQTISEYKCSHFLKLFFYDDDLLVTFTIIYMFNLLPIQHHHYELQNE